MTLSLAKIQQEYKIEPSMGQRLVDTFTPYFELAAPLMAEAAAINITDPTQVSEIRRAGEVRRALKGIRCDAENKRKEVKASVLQMVGAVDFAPKLLASELEPQEKRLEGMEKIAERMEEQRKRQLADKRRAMLQPFLDANEPVLGLEDMTEPTFQALLAGMRTRAERRREEELDRMLAEEAAAEEQERLRAENERLKLENDRQRVIAPFIHGVEDVQRNLSGLSLADFKALVETLRTAWLKRTEEQNRQTKAEEKRVADLIEAGRVKAAEERQAREKAERELAAQKAKEAAEAKRKAAEAAKAAAAPDVEKVKAYIAAIIALPRPSVTDGQCATILDNLAADVGYYLDQAEAL